MSKTKKINKINEEDFSNNPRIKQIADEIQQQKSMPANSTYEIGRLLNEAKEIFGKHGKWAKWRKAEVNYSERQAQYYMKIAKAFSTNPKLVSDLGVTKANMVLALPDNEFEKILTMETEVKKICSMSKRNLADHIKKLNGQGTTETTSKPFNTIKFKNDVDKLFSKHFSSDKPSEHDINDCIEHFKKYVESPNSQKTDEDNKNLGVA